jgi:glutamate-1-semialdehyde 2,1-aminomutase
MKYNGMLPSPFTGEGRMRVASALDSIDRTRVDRLIDRERRTYLRDHPRSRELYERARVSLLAGVPMVWMTMWPGGFPVFYDEAHGSHVTDVDGRTYVDFCLGDTGSMSGHSPAPVAEALRERVEARGGITTMLPSEDAIYVGEELARRFGPPFWQFGTSATDANRNVLRICRQVTKRPWVLTGR